MSWRTSSSPSVFPVARSRNYNKGYFVIRRLCCPLASAPPCGGSGGVLRSSRAIPGLTQQPEQEHPRLGPCRAAPARVASCVFATGGRVRRRRCAADFRGSATSRTHDRRPPRCERKAAGGSCSRARSGTRPSACPRRAKRRAARPVVQAPAAVADAVRRAVEPSAGGVYRALSRRRLSLICARQAWERITLLSAHLICSIRFSRSCATASRRGSR